VPAEEALPNHALRVCGVGPEGRLHLALGQPYDVPPPEKLPLYERLGIGGILRMDRDGQNREVFARGIRNSVGVAFRPGTQELWFTDTDSNGLGDDLPPGEINRAAAPGLHFGFPWYGGGRARTDEYLGGEPPADVVFPVVETAAHATDLGLAFYGGGMFPAEYRGALFSAQRGSAMRRAPVGARVMVTFLAPDGSVREHRPFAEGWLDGEAGRYRGRIVDVAVLPDGSLLVSDDEAGALYRITYDGPR
jgi:glucose/arabinose dehydrogenase